MVNRVRDLTFALVVLIVAASPGCSSSKSPPTTTPPTPSSEQGDESSSPESSQAGESGDGGESAPGDSTESVPAGVQGTGEWDGAKTPEERQAGLDRELDESLGEFDEMLQREQEDAQDQQQAAAAQAEAAAQAAGGGVGGGGALDSGGGLDGEAAEDTGEDSANGPDDGGGRSTAGSGDGSDNTRRPAPPADIPDGADDDIIARQLREAAENETDPELREKLWDEYRKYKTGKSAPSPETTEPEEKTAEDGAQDDEAPESTNNRD